MHIYLLQVNQILLSYFCKMHLFQFSFYGAAILFAIFYYPILVVIFFMFVLAYILISFLYPGAKDVGIRKKIMIATWTNPSEGVIHLNVKVRADKALNFLEKYPKEQRPTMTHIVIKAIGELLHQAPEINGKLVFGKFVPYSTCDACCLVDIGGGKDLANILIEQIDKKSLEDIRDFIKKQGKDIKKNEGNQTHKKRTGPIKLIPSFLVKVLIDMVYFFSHKLGVSVPALGIKKDPFGAMCVTSLGMLGFENATAPFTGFMGCMCFVSVNAVVEEPVIENGKIQIGRTMNVNFTVDHRYIDGARAKRFTEVFKNVFDHPEQFADGGKFARNNKPARAGDMSEKPKEQ